MICRCQIPIIAVLGVLWPNSGHSAMPLEMTARWAMAGDQFKKRVGSKARSYGPLTHGTPDGVTRLNRIISRERTARTALFYDGTVATACREMTSYDANGRFRTLIRPKNGTFYDANLENNSSFTPWNAELRAGVRKSRGN